MSTTRPPISRERMRWSIESSCEGGPSAATITWRRESTRPLKALQNSCCMVLPCRNWKSSISRTSTAANWSLKASVSRWRNAITKLIMKRSAVRNITLRSGRRSFTRCVTADRRCVLPSPEPAWMNSGLKLTTAPGAASATRHMAAWASWFEDPMTKVSNVWYGSSCGPRSAAAAWAAAITAGVGCGDIAGCGACAA